MRARWAKSRWFAPIVLAVPLAITVAALRGLTAALTIFHGSDERVYHLPTIHRFASQLPFPDLVHYRAAQTPLFHLLMAYAGKAIGYQVWRLRLVEVLISYGLAWAVFMLAHRRLGLPRLGALALTLVFMLSPYVFGPSFRVVTDNLTMLFVVVAIERLEKFRQSGILPPFLAAGVCISLAILTRQSAAFMLPVAAMYALTVDLGARRLILALGSVALAAVPASALFLLWHGLVPRGGNPSSCGLCPSAGGPSAAHGLLSVQTVELTLATAALYGVVLFAPQAWCAVASGRARLDRLAVTAAAAGAVLLVIWPARPGPGAHSAGLIWNAARRLPSIDGSSLVFWVLVPLSGLVLVSRLRASPRRWLPLAFFGFFLLGALAIRLAWQKYIDPFVLLALLFTVGPDELRAPRQLLGAAVVAAASVAYAITLTA